VPLRLNQLVIQQPDTPFRWPDIVNNVEWLLAHPDEDLEPVEVEDTGAWCRELGCIYVIRNGKHRFFSYLVAGRLCIPYIYKDTEWKKAH
jgi:hypothetical protein